MKIHCFSLIALLDFQWAVFVLKMYKFYIIKFEIYFLNRLWEKNAVGADIIIFIILRNFNGKEKFGINNNVVNQTKVVKVISIFRSFFNFSKKKRLCENIFFSHFV